MNRMHFVTLLNPVRFDSCANPSSGKKTKQGSDMPKMVESCRAYVKTLLVQHNGTLWIGTRAGHIILVDLSTLQLLQAFNPNCVSVRSMAPVLIGTCSALFISCCISECSATWCCIYNLILHFFEMLTHFFIAWYLIYTERLLK